MHLEKANVACYPHTGTLAGGMCEEEDHEAPEPEPEMKGATRIMILRAASAMGAPTRRDSSLTSVFRQDGLVPCPNPEQNAAGPGVQAIWWKEPPRSVRE